MRLINLLTVVVLLALPYSVATAEELQAWCDQNRTQCAAAINVCETNDELDCDDYMNKVMRGDFENLPEVEFRAAE